MKLISKLIITLITVFAFQFAEAQLNNTRDVPYSWNTDTTNRTLELSEITVAVPRNHFPTINYPKFIGKEEGLSQFFEHEPVISVTINGESKAYPLAMLTMHEISNDSLGGLPILPTFCPLCNSSVVYDRRLTYKGKDYVLDFEVSGMLRNSDMIMADKQTESWWQQLLGEGLVGELAGATLVVIPSQVISISDFFKSYPKGLVLSPQTGTSSEGRYGTNPYENYDSEANRPYGRFFDSTKLDVRLPPMERLIDLEGPKGYKVYPFSVIAEKGVINDNYGGKDIVIFYKGQTVSVLDQKEISKSKVIGSATMFSSVVDNEILTFRRVGSRFKDNQTKSVWDISGRCISGKMKGKELFPERHSNHFAFAWLSFHPESEIYKD